VQVAIIVNNRTANNNWIKKTQAFNNAEQYLFTTVGLSAVSGICDDNVFPHLTISKT
jgi:hypothetical protein